MKKKRAFIFDVDGVLIDSVPLHFAAWKKVFEEEGYKFSFSDYLHKVNGLPRDTGVRNIITGISDDDVARICKLKQDHFLALVDADSPQPLDGVVEFLKYLRSKSILIASASSSKNAPTLLSHAFLTRYFDVVVSGSDFQKSKPDPEIFLIAARRLGVMPEESVVVEDSYLGAMAGKQGGMHVVGLKTSKDESIDKYSDITVESLTSYSCISDFFDI